MADALASGASVLRDVGFKSPSPTRSGSRNSAMRGQELERVPDLFLSAVCAGIRSVVLEYGTLGQASRLSDQAAVLLRASAQMCSTGAMLTCWRFERRLYTGCAAG